MYIIARQIKFQKFWNAKLILNDIERLNPDFYPVPTKEVVSVNEGIKTDLVNITDGFLKKEKFIKVYNSCGKILHSSNPFGSIINYDYYEKQLAIYMEEIKLLLNSHLIKLLGCDNLYLVHMKEEGDEKVHFYIFNKI